MFSRADYIPSMKTFPNLRNRADRLVISRSVCERLQMIIALNSFKMRLAIIRRVAIIYELKKLISYSNGSAKIQTRIFQQKTQEHYSVPK